MRFTQADPKIANFAKTILLVEDEPPVRLLMWHILEQAGYRVILASDGVEGQRKLLMGNVRIDLLLTDLAMPGMSGIELAKRAEQISPGIKIVYASGSQDCFPETRADITCLMKPFTVDELLSAVASKFVGIEAEARRPRRDEESLLVN
jgi:CheY-like chemotaxis protein